MSEADRMLETVATGTPTAGSGDKEEHIVIGMDRVIVVPESLKKIAIQHDHNIETVTFDCPQFWDNHDMSKMSVYINYLRSDGEMGSAIGIITNTDNDTKQMSFTWTISGNVTAANGPLTILVCVKEVDDDGNVTRHWNSELNHDMYVGEGMESYDYEEFIQSDVIIHLLRRMNELEAIGLSHIVDVKEVENGVEIVLTDSTGSKATTIFHGEKGDKGDTGEKGDKGDTGEKGDKGDTGSVCTNIPLINNAVTVDDLLRKYRINLMTYNAEHDVMGIPLDAEMSTNVNSKVFAVVVDSKILIIEDDFGVRGEFDTESGSFKDYQKVDDNINIGSVGVVNNKIFAFLNSSTNIYRGTIDSANLSVTDLTYSGFDLPEKIAVNSSTVIGSKIYILGGLSPRIYVFDTESNSISKLDIALPFSIAYASVAAVGSKVYVFGGYSLADGTVNTIYIYDTESDSISLSNTVLPTPLYSMSAVAIGSKIYLFGGRDEDECYDTIYIYDTESDSISLSNIVLPTPLHSMTAVSIGSYIYVFGGLDISDKCSRVILKYLHDDYTDYIIGIKNHNDIQYDIETKNTIDDDFPILDFEIISFKPNDNNTEVVIAYEFNGVRKTTIIYGDSLDLDSCKLSITGAEKVLGYNMEAGDGSSTGGSSVELDTTLTEEGKAADAKAVGEALAKKKWIKLAEEEITKQDIANAGTYGITGIVCSVDKNIDISTFSEISFDICVPRSYELNTNAGLPRMYASYDEIGSRTFQFMSVERETDTQQSSAPPNSHTYYSITGHWDLNNKRFIRGTLIRNGYNGYPATTNSWIKGIADELKNGIPKECIAWRFDLHSNKLPVGTKVTMYGRKL